MSNQKRRRRAAGSCEWCQAHPYGPCVACMHRGRHALKLTDEEGLAVPQAARKMGLPVAKVRRLIADELDRRDLDRYRCDKVPVSEIRKLVDEHTAIDPTLNHAQIAARAKFKSRIHFERALGYAPWSATTKRGRRYPAKYAEHIDVNTAGVIVRELGIAPREVPAL